MSITVQLAAFSAVAFAFVGVAYGLVRAFGEPGSDGGSNPSDADSGPDRRGGGE